MNRNSPQVLERQLLLGSLLLGCALLSILAMTHHPVAHGDDLAARLESMRHIAGISGLVHGVLIALLATTMLLLGEFSATAVARPALARSGFSLYLLGSALLVLAALINGFAVPAFAISNPALDSSTAAVLQLAWQLNQACAAAGTMAAATSMAIWSWDLYARAGAARAIGAYGVLAGIGLVLGLATGWLHLNVSGMLLAWILLSLWQAGVGVLLLRKS
jgi:hypothetical protein